MPEEIISLKPERADEWRARPTHTRHAPPVCSSSRRICSAGRSILRGTICRRRCDCRLAGLTQPLGGQFAVLAEDARQHGCIFSGDLRLPAREHRDVPIIDVVPRQPRGLTKADIVTPLDALHDGEPLVKRHANDV